MIEDHMSQKEKDLLKHNYKDDIITLNGKEYISLEEFMNAIYNISLSEAIIGSHALKCGGFKLTRKEIVDFMSDGSKVETEFTEDECIVRVST